MTTLHTAAEAVIDAPAPTVLAVLRDFNGRHREILPAGLLEPGRRGRWRRSRHRDELRSHARRAHAARDVARRGARRRRDRGTHRRARHGHDVHRPPGSGDRRNALGSRRRWQPATWIWRAFSSGSLRRGCFTAGSYRRRACASPGAVLVVGDGATGRQIALELAGSHRVILATGKKRSLAPQRVLGRSIFWWLDHLGLLRITGDSRLGRRLRARDTLPRRDLGRSLSAQGRSRACATSDRIRSGPRRCSRMVRPGTSARSSGRPAITTTRRGFGLPKLSMQPARLSRDEGYLRYRASSSLVVLGR